MRTLITLILLLTTTAALANVAGPSVQSAAKSAAQSPVPGDIVVASEAASGPVYLDDVDGINLEFQVEATNSDSYGGSGQTWNNIVSSPWSGASQSDYDFNFGEDNLSSTDDPTFNGTAGDEAAYMSFDGGDLFSLESNTAFVRDLHKTTGGDDFWFAFAFQLPNDSTTDWLFSTGKNEGLRAFINTSQSLGFRQTGASSSQISASASVSEAADIIIVMSHSHSSNQTRFWVETTTGEDVAHTFSTTTTDASDVLKLGRLGDLSNFIANGTRFYTFAGGGKHLSDSEVSNIMNNIAANHPEGRYSFL